MNKTKPLVLALASVVTGMILSELSRHFWVVDQDGYSAKAAVFALPPLAFALASLWFGRSLLPRPRLEASLGTKVLSTVGIVLVSAILVNGYLSMRGTSTVRPSGPTNSQRLASPEFTIGGAVGVWQVPIKEEVESRFAVQSLLLGVWPTPVAVLASSAFFAALHWAKYDADGMAVVFLMGLLLSSVYLAYGLRWSILAHALMNLLNLLKTIGISLPPYLRSSLPFQISFLLLCVVSCAFFLRMVFLLIKGDDNGKVVPRRPSFWVSGFRSRRNGGSAN